MNDKNRRFNNYKFDDFIFDDSFINYASNNNQVDVAKWEKWLSSNPNNIRTAEEAILLIRHLRFKKQELSNEFVKDEWRKLKDKLNLSEITPPIKHRSFIGRKLWKYVAAASLALFFASAIYYFTLTPKCDGLANSLEIIVPRGEIKKVWLPDSTLVFINSESKLKYSDCFNKEDREVFLEGEAFFEVKHNAKKPFVVNAKESEIIVLGTAFNVYAYPNENIFRTSLEKGKITVSHNNNEPIELKVNQTYLLHKDSKQSEVFDSENINAYSSWKEGKVLFKNQSFNSMLPVLERSHNVTFIMQNNEVGKCKYTGCFTTKDDINSIMGIIKLTTPLEYEIINDTVIIK